MSAIASQQQSGANMMSGSQKSGLGSQKPENEYDVEGEEDFEDEEDDEKDGESSLTPMILGGIGVLAVIGIIVLSCMFCRTGAAPAAAPAKQEEAVADPDEPGKVLDKEAEAATSGAFKSLEGPSPRIAAASNRSAAGSKASAGSPTTKTGGVIMLILTGVAAMVVGMLTFAGRSLGGFSLPGAAGNNAKLIGGLTAGAGAIACIIGSMGVFRMRQSMQIGEKTTDGALTEATNALEGNDKGNQGA
jgi:flagellar basal body-associated protein FliL